MSLRFWLFGTIVTALATWASRCHAAAEEMRPGDIAAAAASVVRRVEINPSVPVFVPVHPRIATTVSFPKPIGEPMGTGFVDADAFEKAAGEGKPLHRTGEYVITYLQGDTFFSVQPVQRSDLLNLNVPYEGATLVLYFYLVQHPLQAVASLIFIEPGIAFRSPEHPRSTAAPGAGDAVTVGAGPRSNGKRIERVETLPPSPFIAASPARLDGFLRKLRLIHAAKPGAELEDAARAMKLKVALSSAEDLQAADIINPVSDGGGFELILLRTARDPQLDAVGFVVLMRNKTREELVFDLRTFSARCGAALYTAQVVDAPTRLAPGGLQAGYFAIVGSGDERPGYLLPGNDWHLSLRLLSPQIPPGSSAIPSPADP